MQCTSVGKTSQCYNSPTTKCEHTGVWIEKDCTRKQYINESITVNTMVYNADQQLCCIEHELVEISQATWLTGNDSNIESFALLC